MVILQTQALSQASQKLDQAWMATQVTKGWILDALKPLCRFTSAFVTAAEIGQGDQNCFNAQDNGGDPWVLASQVTSGQAGCGGAGTVSACYGRGGGQGIGLDGFQG